MAFIFCNRIGVETVARLCGCGIAVDLQVEGIVFLSCASIPMFVLHQYSVLGVVFVLHVDSLVCLLISGEMLTCVVAIDEVCRVDSLSVRALVLRKPTEIEENCEVIWLFRSPLVIDFVLRIFSEA